MPVLPLDQPGVAVSEMKRRVRHFLKDFPFMDQVTATVTDSATSLTLASTANWEEDDIIEFDDETDEQAMVRTVTNSTSLLVRRAYPFGEAVAHDANVYILKAPRFGGAQITEAISRYI